MSEQKDKTVFICKKCGLVSEKRLVVHSWVEDGKKHICSGKLIKQKMSDIFPWLKENV